MLQLRSLDRNAIFGTNERDSNSTEIIGVLNTLFIDYLIAIWLSGCAISRNFFPIESRQLFRIVPTVSVIIYLLNYQYNFVGSAAALTGISN